MTDSPDPITEQFDLVDPEETIDGTDSDDGLDDTTALPPDTEERRRLQVSPVPLVVGLLYTAIGLGVLADRQWDGVDLGAVAGTSAIIAGIAVIVLLARRRPGG